MNNHNKTYQPITCQHQPLSNNCRLCGIYLSKQYAVYKTYRYYTNIEVNMQRFLNSLIKKTSKLCVFKSKYQQSEIIYDFLDGISKKFQFSFQTLTLGIYLFNKLIQTSSNQKYKINNYFYASVCLMVAAKSIELDRNIPYFTRYQRYAYRMREQAEYEKAEKQIFQYFNFNVQIPTTATFVNLYLTFGVLFSNDDFDEAKVYLIQEKVKQHLINEVRSGQFILKNAGQLSAKIIYEARKYYKLNWHELLQQYTKVSIDQLQSNYVLKELNVLCLKNDRINCKKRDNNEQNSQQILNVRQRSKLIPTFPSKINYLKFIPSFNSLNIVGLNRSLI